MNEQQYNALREFHDAAVHAIKLLRLWIAAYRLPDSTAADELRRAFADSYHEFDRIAFPEAFIVFAQAYEFLAAKHGLPLQPAGCESWHRVAQECLKHYFPAAIGIRTLVQDAESQLDSHDIIGWLNREWALVASSELRKVGGDKSRDNRKEILNWREYSTADAAELCKKEPCTIGRWAREGKRPYIRRKGHGRVELDHSHPYIAEKLEK